MSDETTSAPNHPWRRVTATEPSPDDGFVLLLVSRALVAPRFHVARRWSDGAFLNQLLLQCQPYSDFDYWMPIPDLFFEHTQTFDAPPPTQLDPLTP